MHSQPLTVEGGPGRCILVVAGEMLEAVDVVPDLVKQCPILWFPEILTSGFRKSIASASLMVWTRCGSAVLQISQSLARRQGTWASPPIRIQTDDSTS